MAAKRLICRPRIRLYYKERVMGKSLLISTIIHALLIVRLPSAILNARISTNDTTLTERDMAFLLSHLLPPPAESKPQAAENHSDAAPEEDAQQKVIRYVYDIMKPRIYENIKPSLGRLKNCNDVVITIEIARSGALLKAVFIRGSGSKEGDALCLDAIRNASPFPTLEKYIDMESLVVTCNFRLSDYRD